MRERYLKKYYWVRPSMLKLIELFNCKNKKQLCNLGKYLLKALYSSTLLHHIFTVILYVFVSISCKSCDIKYTELNHSGIAFLTQCGPSSYGPSDLTQVAMNQVI